MARVGGDPGWSRTVPALLAMSSVALVVTFAVAEASDTRAEAEVGVSPDARAATVGEVVHPRLSPVAPYQDGGLPICDGEPVDCLGRLVTEMTTHVDELGCDHNAVFALLYLRTTEAIQDAVVGGGAYFDEPYFEDPDFLATEAYVFGRYYLDAFAAWEAGDDARVPEAWRIAFEAAAGQELVGFGNILLGINAHVNRDLPYVLENVGLADEDGASRFRDHKAVDDVLAAVAYDVRAEVADRLDPTVDPETLLDPSLIPRWRAYAWDRAEALSDLATGLEPSGDAVGVTDDLETYAAETATGLAQVTAYPEASRDELVAARDAHCRAA